MPSNKTTNQPTNQPHNESPKYDIKQSDGSSFGDLGNVEYPFIAIAPRSSLAQSGSIW